MSFEIDVPEIVTVGKAKERWRYAFSAIFCSRAFRPVVSQTMSLVIDVPEIVTVGKAKERWRYAFSAIFCCRALREVVQDKYEKLCEVGSNTGKGIAAFAWLFDYVVKCLPIPKELQKWLVSPINRPDYHQLTQLVRNKDKDALLQFGGVNGVVRYLQTDARKGINGCHQDITCRQKTFGYNRHHKLITTKSFIYCLMEAIRDPVVMILIVCALLSLGLNIKGKDGWHIGGGILIVVLVVVTVCSLSHIWIHQQIKKLSGIAEKTKVVVIRNSEYRWVSVSNIVVGDIVCLEKGVRVPADGLLLTGFALSLDESLFRVENHRANVPEDENPFLFYGTKVQSGYGRMLVTSVGENTKWAEIVGLPGNESLEWISGKSRLRRLFKFLVLGGSVVGILTSLVLMIQYFTSHLKNGDGENMFVGNRKNGSETWKAVIGIQVSAIVVASSAIPEGLSLAIAITVAYTIKRLMNYGVFPRKLSVFEKLASVTTICLSIEDTELKTDEIRKAVQDCKKAGVSITMITRKNVATAKYLASQCGILDPSEDLDDEQVIKASDFWKYTDAERIGKVKNASMLAEASSLDRLIFVRCLRKKHVVAFIGDSPDDAQALAGADVGIHIGFYGTEIAVENSDMIIRQGALDSILAVLQLGRGIYDDIKVFIQFLFTASIVSLVTDIVSTILANPPPTINILAAVSVSDVPYAVTQIMWVKVIIGTLSALALVAEKKGEDVMHRPLTKLGQPSISNEMCRNILIHALYEIAILLTLQFKGEAIFHLHNNVKDTLIFNLFVLFRVSAVFTPWKSEGNLFSGIQWRKLFWGIVSAIVIIQIVIVETLPRVTATKTLNVWQWVACIGIAFTSWPVGYLGSKYIPVPEEHFLTFLSKPKKHQE